MSAKRINSEKGTAKNEAGNSQSQYHPWERMINNVKQVGY